MAVLRVFTALINRVFGRQKLFRSADWDRWRLDLPVYHGAEADRYFAIWAGEEGFLEALYMCANEGQIAIIEMTGLEAFTDAAKTAFSTMSSYGVVMHLIDACPHPEVVGEILEEAAEIMVELAIEERNVAVMEWAGDDADVDDSWWPDDFIGDPSTLDPWATW